MKLKQKIAVIAALGSFLFAAGIIETNTFGALGLLGITGAAVIIGGLDSKRTSVEQIAKDYKL